MNPADRTLAEQNFLFHGMDFTSVEYMLERSSVRSLAAGEKLLQPDTPNHHLHLILEGKLSVYLVAQETLEYTSLLAGECAGEISLVDGKHPSALVIAAEPSRVLSVPHDTVWSLADHSHEIARNLLEIIAGRMRNDNMALIASQNRKTQFEHQAYVDALTGIYNRRWMGNAFPRALHRCALDKLPFAVMVVDIDHFKQVNDTHGHLVGDLALKIVARCMAENLRPHDLLARYGGEEFAVLLPDASLEEARAIAGRLRAMIADTEICCDGLSFKVTISIGITPSRHEETLENLIREADHALYRAKELGRNRVEVFAKPEEPPA
jgi:diguanylate cyclase (GGDEF)-like protein